MFSKIYIFCNANKTRVNTFDNLNRLSKPVFILVYALTIMYLFYMQNTILPTFIIYPFLLLLLNILLRKSIKRTRPFNNPNLNLENLGVSDSYSLPSNHASSSIVISLSMFYVNNCLAIIMLILALITSFSRVARGYHYPTDILCSAVLSLLIFTLSILFPIVL